MVCRSGARAYAPAALERAAELAIAREQYGAAAGFWGAAEGLRQQIGMPIWPVDLRLRAPLLAMCRMALGDQALDDAWSSGKQRDWEAAIEDAIGTEQYDTIISVDVCS